MYLTSNVRLSILFFEEKFRALGGVVDNIWPIDHGENADITETLDGLVENLITNRAGSSDAIFLATHSNEAEKIIVAIKRNNIPMTIIGPDSIGDPIFGERFDTYPEEKTKPGFFLNGVYATAPLVFDVSGEAAQQFKDQFTKKYGQSPGWTAATYYDAALTAIKAFENANIQGNPTRLAAERANIRDRLEKFTLEDEIKGLSGPIYFDQNGNIGKIDLGANFGSEADKLADIGVYQNQRFISAWTQLEYLTNGLSSRSVMKELSAGRIIMAEGVPIYKTNVVYTGIDINEVSKLDVANSSYTIDFYLWFRYQGQFGADELPPDAVEFINSAEPLSLRDIEPLDEETRGGVTYRVYRIKAAFKSDFDFKKYPFDDHTLEIKFRHPKLTRAKLIYAVDKAGMRQTTNEAILEKFARTNVFDAIANWLPAEARFFQDIRHNESTLGNPRLVNADATINYSRFNATIRIKRNILFFSIKNLFPMFVILGLSYMIFFLPLSQSTSAYSIVTGALLTTAFFHLNVASHLPGIGYIVALDFIFHFIYALLAIQLIIAVIIHQAYEAENQSSVTRLRNIGRISYPSFILIGSILFSYIFIFE